MGAKLPDAFSFLFDDVADDGLTVRYRAAYGGRGSAKSHSFAGGAIIKARQQPLRVGVFREIQKSIRDSVKRLLDDKISEFGLRYFYESTDTEIRGANGSLFTFGGLRTNPDAVKSTEGLDIALVVEANRVAQRSWDLLIPTVRKPGSEIWAEWNPEFPTDPVDVMFRGPDGPPPGSIVRRINWQDNPFFPEVLKTELEFDRRRDPEKYAHVWEGEYSLNSEARVFKNWKVEEFDTPKDAIHRFGADWGFSIDPTVLVRCHIDGRKLFVDAEAWDIGCDIDYLPALFAGDDREHIDAGRAPRWQNPRRFKGVPFSRDYLIRADSARPETVSYMKRQGFKIQAALKGQGSLEDGVEFLRSFDIVVHPRCAKVIEELTLYAYKTDEHTGDILPALEDKNNHTIDALRYALEELRRSGYRPQEQETTKRRHDYGFEREDVDSWKTV